MEKSEDKRKAIWCPLIDIRVVTDAGDDENADQGDMSIAKSDYMIKWFLENFGKEGRDRLLKDLDDLKKVVEIIWEMKNFGN